jgi:hypothetical protein
LRLKVNQRAELSSLGQAGSTTSSAANGERAETHDRAATRRKAAVSGAALTCGRDESKAARVGEGANHREFRWRVTLFRCFSGRDDPLRVPVSLFHADALMGERHAAGPLPSQERFVGPFVEE